MICVCTLNHANEYLTQKYEVVTDLPSLYKMLVKKDLRKIIFTDEYVDKFFTETTLNKFIESSKRLNELLEFEVSASRRRTDKDTLDYIRMMRDHEDFVNFAIRDPESLRKVQEALQENVNAREEVLKAGSKLSSMQLELAKETKAKEEAQERERITAHQLSSTSVKLTSLVSRINNKYNKKLDSSNVMGVVTKPGSYKKILYIKEITRVKYVDTLLYYLQEIIRTINDYPIRFLVIESLESLNKAYLYPRCIPHTQLTYGDVWSSDIFLAGFQQNLVTDICANTANMDYMIVLDRSGWQQPYIEGNNVELLWTASTLEDADSYPHDRLITYNKKTLRIPYVEKFDSMSMGEKMAAYSSMDIMKKLIQILED